MQYNDRNGAGLKESTIIDPGAEFEILVNGTVFTGGEHLTDGYFARGFYVEPTVAGLPAGHRLFQDELFAPLTAVAPVARTCPARSSAVTVRPRNLLWTE